MVEKEVLEFIANEEKINEIIIKLNELKESKRHVHIDIRDQIGIIGEDVKIEHLLIHHNQEEK